MQVTEFKKFPFPVFYYSQPDRPDIFVANTGSKLAYLSLVFGVGSMDDIVYPGITHFIEHLIHSQLLSGRYEDLLLGGVSTNAYTAGHFVEFWASGLAEDQDKILKALCEVCFNPVFDSRLVEQQKKLFCVKLLKLLPKIILKLG